MIALRYYYCILDFVYTRCGHVFLSCCIRALLVLSRKYLLGIAPSSLLLPPLLLAAGWSLYKKVQKTRELVITQRVQGTEAGLPGRVEKDASRSRDASCNASAEIQVGTHARRELLCRGAQEAVFPKISCPGEHWLNLSKEKHSPRLHFSFHLSGVL